MNKVKLLPPNIIKQIAAGEVIESPAAVVKELLENSIDAFATNIEISIRNGGKSFISVLDDGDGILKDDLRNTLFKHTTSKLSDNDLYNIRTMGFRGEALFSIAYMSKLTIKSKAKDSSEAYEVYAENDYVGNIKLSNLPNHGTYIEVRDLFFSFPARLKFLKSDIAEANSIYKIVDFIAMAHPHIGFKVFNNGKKVIEYTRSTLHLKCKNFYETIKDSLKARLSDVISNEFVENSLFVYTPSVDFVIYGYCSIPTYNIHNTSKQFLFVNKRFIKEKTFFGIIKAAYSGVMENGRSPIAVIFIDINPEAIDVNVSPSKTEVKFRNFEQIKGFLIGSIKNTIKAPEKQKTSTILPLSLIHTMNKQGTKRISPNVNNKYTKFNQIKYVDFNLDSNAENVNTKSTTDTIQELKNNLSNDNFGEKQLCLAEECEVHSSFVKKDNNEEQVKQVIFDKLPNLIPENKLGYAKAQYNNNWILAECKKGLVIVDQHAAHERITQERLYNQFVSKEVITNMLLLPELVKLAKKDIDTLISFKPNLDNLGLVIDKFGDNDIIIREYPKILGDSINFKNLIESILIDLKDIGSPEFFLTKLRAVIAKIACHSSVRAGDKISVEEMNELLRQIEKTENSGECPHGRPTYTILSWNDIDRLFGRR